MSYAKLTVWKRLESGAAIFIGLAEILAGLALVVFIGVAPPTVMSWAAWIPGVMTHLGVALLAAGAVTATLEPISRRRQQNDIDEIKKTHFEAMLKGVMPEAVFDEVQAHIIRQPFLRENFRVTYEFKWGDSTRATALKYLAGYYEVTNLSRTLESYEVRVLVEKMLNPQHAGFDGIKEIIVDEGPGMKRCYTGEELNGLQKITDQLIEARVPVQVAPGEKVRVTSSSQSEISDRTQILVVNVPTIGLDLTVVHPDDMVVRAMPLHPSRSAFVNEVNNPTVKRWRINGALLPYQGIELSWSPISPG